MLSRNSLITAKPESQVVACDVEGEVALLSLQNETYYSLDSVGSFVWNLLQERRSVEEIYRKLLQQYEVEPEQCERDLYELLGQLRSAELIEVGDVASS